MGAVHFHTSAKMNSGIEELFLSLCRMMIEKSDKQNDDLVTLNRSGSTRRTLVIDDEDAVPSEGSSRWCCSS